MSELGLSASVGERDLVFFIKSANNDVESLLVEPKVDVIQIGRRDSTRWDGDGHFYVDDRYMSRRHCQLTWSDEQGWILEDLNSANGTICGGVSLQDPKPIGTGVLMQLGTSIVRVQPASAVSKGELQELRRRADSVATDPVSAELSDASATALQAGSKSLMSRYEDFDPSATLIGTAVTVGPSDVDFSKPMTAAEQDPDLNPELAETVSGNADAAPAASGELSELLADLELEESATDTVLSTSARPEGEADAEPDLLADLDFGGLDDDVSQAGATANADGVETGMATSRDSDDKQEAQATLMSAARPEAAAESTVLSDDIDLFPTGSDAELPPALAGLDVNEDVDADATRIANEAAMPAAQAFETADDLGDATRLAPSGAGMADATMVGIDQPDSVDTQTGTDVSTFVPESESPEATQIGTGVVYESYEPEQDAGDDAALDSQVDTDRSLDADATLIGDGADAQSFDLALDGDMGAGSVPLVGMARRLVEIGLMDETTAVELTLDARAHGKTFFRTLAESRAARFIDEIYQWVSEQYGYEVIDAETDLFDQVIESTAMTLQQSADNGVLLIQPDGNAPNRVAMVDPFDVMTLDWIRDLVGSDLSVAVARTEAMLGAIERIKNTGLETEEIGLIIDLNPEQEQHINDHMGDIDIPQMVNYFLHRASLAGASDIHIEPTEDRMLVRFRVNGILYEERSLAMAHHMEIASRLKIMSGMNVAEKRRPQDGRIGGLIRGKQIDVRVSTFPTVHGEKIVMRLLDKSALRPSPEHLGLLPRDLRLLKEKIHAPFGLVMISGPTGSGKTTTLYSCLGSIDKTQKNVLTVEDPVEYQMAGVHQMQVNHKIDLTFASGLRTILRQDPDVIMVGECRDRETAEMAIQASMTGHIVFSTIHTNDAVGVVTRLIDMGIEPFLVASALSLAIAQRLIREVCPHCKTTVMGEEIIEALARDGITETRLQALGIEIDEDLDYAEGKGCKHCRFTGYSQRRAVFEVFEITDSVRSVIVSPEFTDQRLRAVAAESGMTTLIDHGLKLVDDEVTTFYEVIRVLGESI